jgi:hypothetical protein
MLSGTMLVPLLPDLHLTHILTLHPPADDVTCRDDPFRLIYYTGIPDRTGFFFLRVLRDLCVQSIFEQIAKAAKKRSHSRRKVGSTFHNTPLHVEPALCRLSADRDCLETAEECPPHTPIPRIYPGAGGKDTRTGIPIECRFPQIRCLVPVIATSSATQRAQPQDGLLARDTDCN